MAEVMQQRLCHTLCFTLPRHGIADSDWLCARTRTSPTRWWRHHHQDAHRSSRAGCLLGLRHRSWHPLRLDQGVVLWLGRLRQGTFWNPWLRTTGCFQQTPKAPHTQALSNYVNGFVLETSFNWGFWDILAWNDIKTIDGIQSLIFDETTTLDSVTAYTNMTMNSSRYHAPQFTRSFYQPEGLFAAYEQGIDINRNLNDFYYDEERGLWVKNINMLLEPITYIYLTQVIFHNNKGRVVAVEGNANLSGMARSVVLNSGIAGSDAIVVDYNVRFKKDCNMNGESVDIAGGRLMSFGMCNINGTRFAQSRAGVTRADDGIKHYMDVTMQFSNGMDSTLVFDVTDQVQTRYKGGVITVELDMDTVPIPRRKGGSGFDAVVVDYEDGGTHEFEM